jgi:hypothetical protein
MLIGPHAVRPISQHGDKLRMQWKHVLFAMFGYGCLHGQRGRIAVQVETSRRQAGHFLAAQPCHVRDDVDPRTLLTGQIGDDFLAHSSGFHELRHFVRRQRAARMPDIDIGVQPLDAHDRIGRQASRSHQPIAERIERLDVMVIRAMPKVFRFAHFLQCRGNGLRVDIAGDIEAAFLNQPSHPVHQQLDVLLRVRGEALFKRGQVSGKRKRLLQSDSFILWVDQASLAKHGFVLQLGPQLLGKGLVGEPFPCATDALVIRVRHVPKGPPLLLVSAAFEYRRHGLFPPGTIFARSLRRATRIDPLHHLITPPTDRAANPERLGNFAGATQTPDAPHADLQ